MSKQSRSSKRRIIDKVKKTYNRDKIINELDKDKLKVYNYGSNNKHVIK